MSSTAPQLDLPVEARRRRKRRIVLPWAVPRITLREVALLTAMAVYGRATVTQAARPYALRLVRLDLLRHPPVRPGQPVDDQVFHVTMKGAALVTRLSPRDAATLHTQGVPMARPLPD